MADPFSIVAGTLGVVDVCTRFVTYLNTIREKAGNIGEEVDLLEREIKTFEHTYTNLSNLTPTVGQQDQSRSLVTAGGLDPRPELWARAGALISDGRRLVEELKNLLQRILGGESSWRSRIVQDVRMAIRLSSQSTEYDKVRNRFTVLNLELSMMLTAIELTSNQIFHSAVFTALEELDLKQSQHLQQLGVQLKQQITEVEQAVSEVTKRLGVLTIPSVTVAKAAVLFTSLNKHFDLPKAEDPMWTGREKDLDRLRDAILKPDPGSSGSQKRFVVQGMSGTGKSHLACKFAQDFRESFWGIFWIDASSEQNARDSWIRIARFGKRDANERAGKYWLSNLQSPWLLLIENADGSEQSIISQFPTGGRGCLLITSRNVQMENVHTIGFLRLDRLEENEANELLRKVTKHKPWDDNAKTSASSIARHLVYYPLALVHAGSAIRHGITTLYSYIEFFNAALDGWRRRVDFSISNGDEDDEDGLGAFTTFDITYSGLEVRATRNNAEGDTPKDARNTSKDAIELINMFAFLHYNDIHLDILTKAGRNVQQLATVVPEKEETRPSTVWLAVVQQVEGFAEAAYKKFFQSGPTLPQILRISGDPRLKQSQDPLLTRARQALRLLVRISLLSEGSARGSYYMHPLVHLWIRKRLSLTAQALWCGVAGDVLATSIKVPPLTDETGDQELYTRMLPHIVHFRERKDEIDNLLFQNRERASYLRFWTQKAAPPLTASDVFRLARYSRIYLECGKYREGEELLRLAQDFVVGRLGKGSRLNVQISLVLSKLFERLGRTLEAQELQEEALQICKLKFGATHSLTLKVMDALGETYQLRLRLREAKALHQSAIKGMEGKPFLKPREAIEGYLEHERALELEDEVITGLIGAYGEDDLDAIFAQDHKAMTLYEMGGADRAQTAHTLMENVFAKRKAKLGEEHLYTLWAGLNLARTKTLRASLENDSRLVQDAIDIYDGGLVVITRNTNENHFGVLMGRGCRADALVVQKKYQEAEDEYKDVAERQRNLPGSRAGTHVDRLSTLEKLVDCLVYQEKFEEAVSVRDTAITEIDALGGQNHPWREKMTNKRIAVTAMA